MKSKVGDAKRRLVCFSETVGRRKEDNDQISGPEKLECALEDGEVADLDVCTSRNSPKLPVVVTYASGRVIVASEKLEKTQHLQLDIMKGGELEYATTLDLESARKGSLKYREDVVASIGQSQVLLLCAILRQGDKRIWRLYSLKPSVNTSLQTAEPTTRLLLDQALPKQETSSTSPPTYELQAASGTLYQLLEPTLSVYDLSGTSPRLTTACGSSASPVSSFARMSSSITLTSNMDIVALYETKYGSLYGSIPLSLPNNTGSQSKKRKRETNGETQSSPMQQLCSIAETGPVVALRGQELVIIHLGDSLRASKRGRSQGTRLADIVARSQLHSSQGEEISTKQQAKFKQWTTVVDTLVDADDIEGLEKLVATDPQLGEQLGFEGDVDSEQEGEVHQSDRTAYEDLWPLPEPFESSRIDQRKAMYLVAQMFGSTKNGLALRILSLKLLEWLALAGLLSAAQISRAWLEYGDHPLTDETRVLPGNVMLALQPFDEDFQLSHELLSLPAKWEIEEIIQALRAVVQSFDDPANEADNNQTLALPAIPQQPNGDVLMANGSTMNGNGAHSSSSDLDLDSEALAAEQELDHALTALSSGLEVRSDTLRLVFARLLSFSPDTITANLRALMSHRELIFFIHVLRIELADGGWTSRYIGTGGNNDEEGGGGEEQGMVNAMEGAEESGPSNEALKTIGDLLNCAVDAIGTSGWLVGLGSNAVTAQELLTSLRAEVSAGLEQCYEADTLGSALVEIEKFASMLEKEAPVALGAPEQMDEDEDTMLPMGGRVRPVVMDGLGRREGVKSDRAMAAERRKRVGKYSFDRIRI